MEPPRLASPKQTARESANAIGGWQIILMAIQWFPGHMHLTRKAIAERIKDIDVVIEMIDARLPGSSANPMLAELIEGKPVLKVLSKQDMADPLRTQAWLGHYNALPGVRALAMDTSMTAPAKALKEACQVLAPCAAAWSNPCGC